MVDINIWPTAEVRTVMQKQFLLTQIVRVEKNNADYENF